VAHRAAEHPVSSGQQRCDQSGPHVKGATGQVRSLNLRNPCVTAPAVAPSIVGTGPARNDVKSMTKDGDMGPRPCAFGCRIARAEVRIAARIRRINPRW
jgi:hypothetical protein